MNTHHHIRVVIADNNPVMLEAIRQLLESAQIKVIDQAKDGEQAVRLTKSYQPDVLLLELKMPKLNGLAVTRQLREEKSAIVAYSAQEDKATVLAMLQAGAKGYVLKSESGKKVIKAVKTVSQGQFFLSESIQNHAYGGVSNAWPYKSQLSSREQQIACLVAKEKSNTQIACQLFITPSTVKCHIKSIRRKLGVDSRLGIAMQALRLGFICMGEIEEELQLV